MSTGGSSGFLDEKLRVARGFSSALRSACIAEVKFWGSLGRGFRACGAYRGTITGMEKSNFGLNFFDLVTRTTRSKSLMPLQKL